MVLKLSLLPNEFLEESRSKTLTWLDSAKASGGMATPLATPSQPLPSS